MLGRDACGAAKLGSELANRAAPEGQSVDCAYCTTGTVSLIRVSDPSVIQLLPLVVTRDQYLVSIPKGIAARVPQNGCMYCQRKLQSWPIWGFWHGRRPRMRSLSRSLCKWRGRHVTRSFSSKEPPCRFIFTHPPLPVQVPMKTSMIDLTVRLKLVRFGWAHPSVASSPLDTTPQKRYALLPVSCADIGIQ